MSADRLDIVPHCTVLCEQLSERFGLGDRLVATGDAANLTPQEIARYDGFFVSRAVRPKDEIIHKLLTHKQASTRIYSTGSHLDLRTARTARRLWAEAKGEEFPLPPGCETTHQPLEGALHERYG